MQTFSVTNYFKDKEVEKRSHRLFLRNIYNYVITFKRNISKTFLADYELPCRLGKKLN